MDDDQKQVLSKPPVVRGARACSTCRAAKMKCVGAEDGIRPCQRCKRANVECVFEKHRRGRKPGSKLSEASKMLRKLEKGLSTAKLKSQSTHGAGQFPDLMTPNALLRDVPTKHFAGNHLPPLNLSQYPNAKYPSSSSSSRTMDVDDDDDDPEREGPFPANVISNENKRNSFFTTILNPTDESNTPQPSRYDSLTPPSSAPPSSGLLDPISAHILSEEDAGNIFDMVLLRLNPFINLFDPALHTTSYIRSRCPFLFTAIIMAGCKFFKADAYKPCQKLAKRFTIQAFAEAWKSVEVVQAFACMTYWKDPGDDCTWTYIGYACRMAVELGLNRFFSHPPPNESELQLRERRNRERTYLALWIYDRSLSTQTGRNWMLPEDEFIRHSSNWHEKGGGPIRPEDVIMAAFVSLRHIAAETTEVFQTSRRNGSSHSDVNYELVLKSCNAKLTQWAETWEHEMQRAEGDRFHFSFLSFWRLYIRLFLNSFGIHDCISSPGHGSPSVSALSQCYYCALESLKIISDDFVQMGVLPYGQDVITIMSAYSAVVLLRLLRSDTTSRRLEEEGASHKIHALIAKTADAYQEAASLSPAVSMSAACHSRFLRHLLESDVFRTRKADVNSQIDPSLSGPSEDHTRTFSESNSSNSHPSYPPPTYPSSEHFQDPMRTFSSFTNFRPPANASEIDARYWKGILLEMGFGMDGGSGHSSLIPDHGRTYEQHPYQNHNMVQPSYG